MTSMTVLCLLPNLFVNIAVCARTHARTHTASMSVPSSQGAQRLLQPFSRYVSHWNLPLHLHLHLISSPHSPRSERIIIIAANERTARHLMQARPPVPSPKARPPALLPNHPHRNAAHRIDAPGSRSAHARHRHYLALASHRRKKAVANHHQAPPPPSPLCASCPCPAFRVPLACPPRVTADLLPGLEPRSLVSGPSCETAAAVSPWTRKGGRGRYCLQRHPCLTRRYQAAIVHPQRGRSRLLLGTTGKGAAAAPTTPRRPSTRESQRERIETGVHPPPCSHPSPSRSTPPILHETPN